MSIKVFPGVASLHSMHMLDIDCCSCLTLLKCYIIILCMFFILTLEVNYSVDNQIHDLETAIQYVGLADLV